jgi:hypothetical protein
VLRTYDTLRVPLRSPGLRFKSDPCKRVEQRVAVMVKGFVASVSIIDTAPVVLLRFKSDPKIFLIGLSRRAFFGLNCRVFSG